MSEFPIILIDAPALLDAPVSGSAVVGSMLPATMRISGHVGGRPLTYARSAPERRDADPS